MGESMRFAGKVDGWFYALAIGMNAMLAWRVATFLADPSTEGALVDVAAALVCIAFCDLLIVPMLLRNYVEFDGEGDLIVVFGFQKATYPVSKIRQARETRNPLASLAASLDRIDLRIGYDELMIAVRDKERFYEELRRRCPDAVIERRMPKRTSS